MPKAKEAAQKALALDPSLVEAHASLGYIHLAYDWDLAAAEREFQQAAALDPSYPPARRWKAQLLIAKADLQGAIAELESALQLDPLSLPTNTALAEAYYYARDYDHAVHQAHKTLELQPGFVLAEFNLGRALLQLGRNQEALEALERARAISRNTPGQLMSVTYARAVSGDRAGALQLQHELLAIETAIRARDLCCRHVHRTERSR
jgi:tetratricopeptide (TPR) repeat protein